MTEKRFTYKHFDWLQWHIYDNGEYLVECSGNEEEDIKPLVECLNNLHEENEQLKQFLQELTTKGTGKIHLADGSIYKVNAILTDFNR